MKLRTQAFKRLAHGGLRHVQYVCRFGNAGSLQQYAKNNEEMQIALTNIVNLGPNLS